MSSPEKRARENRKAKKKREKEQRRWEKRERGASEIEVVTAEEVVGEMRSIEEVMAQLDGGAGSTARGGSDRGAASVPAKLFVGGLSYDTSDDGLKKAFEKYGEVAEAIVITDRDTGRSRGFGFVTMADRKDAPKAIKGLDGTDLDGRTIVVNVATERR